MKCDRHCLGGADFFDVNPLICYWVHVLMRPLLFYSVVEKRHLEIK